jgi:hypothetical protein
MQAEFDFEQLLFAWMYEQSNPNSTGKTSRDRAGYVEFGTGQGPAKLTAKQHEVPTRKQEHEQSGSPEDGKQ